MSFKSTENLMLIEELNDPTTKFTSLNDAVSFLKDYEASLDKAKADPGANTRAELILHAYVMKCSNPEANIRALTVILGEEDINLKLLKSVQSAIEKRATKDSLDNLPSLKTHIEAVTMALKGDKVKPSATAETENTEKKGTQKSR